MLVPFAGVPLALAPGAAGDRLYFRHGTAKVRKARATHAGDDVLPHLAKTGGVNRWVIPATIAVAILLSVLAFLL